MRLALRKRGFYLAAGLSAMLLASVSLAAQEKASAGAEAARAAETIFRWLNFALVFAAFAWVILKFGRPYFRRHALSIAGEIRQATEARAAAERELQEATQKLAGMDLEVQDLRRAAVRESTLEAERIRDMTQAEVEKIAQTAQGEIKAAERVSQQELRAAVAHLATDRAADMVQAQMTAGADAALFHAFVGELRRSAS